MAAPQSPKMVQYMLLLSFATLPILLLVFIASQYKGEPNGNTMVPVLVSAVSFCGALYWLLNRLDTNQSPSEFQTNMLIALAFGELCTLMGIFLGQPSGLSPYPFVGANFVVVFLAFARLNAYWSSRSA
jgi:hypothetical protein